MIGVQVRKERGKVQLDYYLGSMDKITLGDDNPEKAIISLQNDRGTSYKTYIQVQNELTKAYNELRNTAALSEFGSRYYDLPKSKQRTIRKKYPQKISEAEPKNVGKNE